MPRARVDQRQRFRAFGLEGSDPTVQSQRRQVGVEVAEDAAGSAGAGGRFALLAGQRVAAARS
jgi:hypothetical protein